MPILARARVRGQAPLREVSVENVEDVPAVSGGIVVGGTPMSEDDMKREQVVPLALVQEQLKAALGTLPGGPLTVEVAGRPLNFQLTVPGPLVEYVCGFLVDAGRSRVALVKKDHPWWQRGRWNGVGGKIEPGETPAQAMRREFEEEAGLDLDSWGEPKAVMQGDGWRVYYFAATVATTAALFTLKARTSEPVGIHQLDRLPDNVLPNVRWLIPLCLDPDVTGAVVYDRWQEGKGQTRGGTGHFAPGGTL